MKTVFALLVLLGGFSAGAVTPVRQATLKVLVHKAKASTQSDGTIAFSDVAVCSGEVTVDVYMKSNLGHPAMQTFSCPGEIAGVATKVSISAISILANATYFPDDAPGELQDTMVNMSADQNGVILPQLMGALSITSRGFNTPSVLGTVAPYQIFDCKNSSCNVLVPEYFYAQFELKN